MKDLDETTRMQYVDLYFWLVGDILLKTDKMSMAHSLESRVPFLDRRVFDVSATIPTPLKANETQTKLTLREASERAIPKDWAQKEKLGFPVPVVNWLRQDRYYNQVKEWFTGDIAREFFNTDELVRLLDEHKAGADRSRKIWIVYMFLMVQDLLRGQDGAREAAGPLVSAMMKTPRPPCNPPGCKGASLSIKQRPKTLCHAKRDARTLVDGHARPRTRTSAYRGFRIDG